MLTGKDIGKTVLLRFEMEDEITGKIKRKWENPGAKLSGFTSDGSKLLVKMPDKTTIKVKHEFARILEPRPG